MNALRFLYNLILICFTLLGDGSRRRSFFVAALDGSRDDGTVNQNFPKSSLSSTHWLDLLQQKVDGIAGLDVDNDKLEQLLPKLPTTTTTIATTAATKMLHMTTAITTTTHQEEEEENDTGEVENAAKLPPVPQRHSTTPRADDDDNKIQSQKNHHQEQQRQDQNHRQQERSSSSSSREVLRGGGRGGGVHDHHHGSHHHHVEEANKHQDKHMNMKNMDGMDDDGMDDMGNDFCNGMSMIMAMGGFQFSTLKRHKGDCITYFVQEWKLSDKGKFVGAMFYSFLLAIITEALTSVQQRIKRYLQPGKLRKSIMSILYGIQQLFGYVVMFITMTYSIELFGAVLIGLMMGNVLYPHSKRPGDDDGDYDNDEIVDSARPMTPQRRRAQAQAGAGRSTGGCCDGGLEQALFDTSNNPDDTHETSPLLDGIAAASAEANSSALRRRR